MPYVAPEDRFRLAYGAEPMTPGELNFVITKQVDRYLDNTATTSPGYAAINEAIGVLECAKLELYRRIAAPYEDEKIVQNGDVYTCV